MKYFSWQDGLLPFSDLPPTASRVLIESTVSRPKLHALLIYGHLLTQAKKMVPVFVATGEERRLIESLAPSYLGRFEVVEPLYIGLMMRTYLLLVATCIWIRILFGYNLVKLRWRRLQVGDIVYDQYLAGRQHARLHRMDVHLIKYIYITLRGVEISELTLTMTQASAVLLSHRVGVWAASLANAAQRRGLHLYSYGGDRYGTLILSPARKSYEYSATLNELEPILTLKNEELDRLFDYVKRELFKGAFNADAKLAFSRKIYQDRIEFTDDYGLQAGKRNIFIMLHAFTDYPHSHFDGMLFNDFHDWFIKTLEHAGQNKSVNWIVKSHPASHFYPVRDINWQKIKKKFHAKHIAFMPEDANFDTRSISYVGDAVITCIGSAGFELSAMAGLPSITAGDNPYAESGFAIYPKTRDEYFNVLANIAKMERLTGDALRRAKAAFVFIHRLSRVKMSLIPALSHAEHRSFQRDDRYFERVAKDFMGNSDWLKDELNHFKLEIEKPNFVALRTSCLEYLDEYERV